MCYAWSRPEAWPIGSSMKTTAPEKDACNVHVMLYVCAKNVTNESGAKEACNWGWTISSRRSGYTYIHTYIHARKSQPRPAAAQFYYREQHYSIHPSIGGAKKEQKEFIPWKKQKPARGWRIIPFYPIEKNNRLGLTFQVSTMMLLMMIQMYVCMYDGGRVIGRRVDRCPRPRGGKKKLDAFSTTNDIIHSIPLWVGHPCCSHFPLPISWTCPVDLVVEWAANLCPGPFDSFSHSSVPCQNRGKGINDC